MKIWYIMLKCFDKAGMSNRATGIRKLLYLKVIGVCVCGGGGFKQ